MESITISLPDTLKQFVDNQLSDRGFSDVSEYFRSLLCDAQAREEEEARLEKLLLEGLASERIPFDETFKARLAEKTVEIFERHKTPAQR